MSLCIVSRAVISFSFLLLFRPSFLSLFFFFNDTATTEIYTLSLHDALPISLLTAGRLEEGVGRVAQALEWYADADRKSTRLNSSHGYISYAVFCLKKKKKKKESIRNYKRNKQAEDDATHRLGYICKARIRLC